MTRSGHPLRLHTAYSPLGLAPPGAIGAPIRSLTRATLAPGTFLAICSHSDFENEMRSARAPRITMYATSLAHSDTEHVYGSGTILNSSR